MHVSNHATCYLPDRALTLEKANIQQKEATAGRWMRIVTVLLMGIQNGLTLVKVAAGKEILVSSKNIFFHPRLEWCFS